MVTQLPIKFFMSAVTNSFQKGAHSAPDFSPIAPLLLSTGFLYHNFDNTLEPILPPFPSNTLSVSSHFCPSLISLPSALPLPPHRSASLIWFSQTMFLWIKFKIYIMQQTCDSPIIFFLFKTRFFSYQRITPSTVRAC